MKFIPTMPVTFHAIPNGGYAALDQNNKLVAYTKMPLENSPEWQWVRSDCKD